MRVDRATSSRVIRNDQNHGTECWNRFARVSVPGCQVYVLVGNLRDSSKAREGAAKRVGTNRTQSTIISVAFRSSSNAKTLFLSMKVHWPTANPVVEN